MPLEVFSPDDLPITPFEFLTREDAEAFADGWAQRFHQQGYYETGAGERIPFAELRNRLQIKEVQP